MCSSLDGPSQHPLPRAVVLKAPGGPVPRYRSSALAEMVTELLKETGFREIVYTLPRTPLGSAGISP